MFLKWLFIIDTGKENLQEHESGLQGHRAHDSVELYMEDGLEMAVVGDTGEDTACSLFGSPRR